MKGICSLGCGQRLRVGVLWAFSLTRVGAAPAIRRQSQNWPPSRASTGADGMSAGTSPTVWAAGPARCPIPIPRLSAIRSAASMAACRPATITFSRPGCFSAPKPILRSRIFKLRGWLDLYREQRRKAPPSPTRSITSPRCAGVSVTHSIIGSSTEPAALPGRRRASAKLPASPAMRTRSCSRAPAGRSASAPRSQLRRTGRRGSNISTTASAPSPASFPRARVTSQSSTSRRCGSGSTTSSA